MNAFSEIFQNVHIITIERNKKRREYIDNALSGIDFTYYYGLDLTKDYLHCKYVINLPEEVFEKYEMDKEHCQRWSKGQFGVFATEKKLIVDFASRGKNENLVLLLDDIVFEKDWKQTLTDAYNELPENWDALILGTRLGKAKSRRFRFLIKLKRGIDSLLTNNKRYTVSKFSEHLDKCEPNIHGIFGIVYSPDGLQKLLNEPSKLRCDQDDVLLSKLIGLGYMNVYITYPMVGREGVYDGSWTKINHFEESTTVGVISKM